MIDRDRLVHRHPAAEATLRLLDDPALDVVWDRCRVRLERGGQNPQLSITDATDETRAVLNRVLGRAHRGGRGGLRVPLGTLDDALRRSPLGIGLAEWLTVRSGEPLVDKQAERAAADARRARLLRVVSDSPLAAETWAERWVDELIADGMLTRLAASVEDEVLADAVQLLVALPVDDVPLAVLAARVTGDTKALTDTTIATVLERALALRCGQARPRTAGERRALWAEFGVRWDDLASQVLVLNLPGAGIDQLSAWLGEAAAWGEPFRVTLRQLTNTQDLGVRPGLVRVCENPAVVMEAADQLGSTSGPLVCVEGRPSTAANYLLERLVVGGCRLAYHGDFDRHGLSIASALIDQERCQPWRFGASEYRQAVDSLTRTVPLPEPAGPSPWDPQLSIAMSEARRVVYEEQVIDDLLADLSD